MQYTDITRLKINMMTNIDFYLKFAMIIFYLKIQICCCCCSLGMTILELASDLDLPRGGDGWHMLRSGKLPEEFLRGNSQQYFMFDYIYSVIGV